MEICFVTANLLQSMKTLENEPALLGSEANRQRLVANMLNLTQSTPLAPSSYEMMLLDQFVRGQLSIDRVVALLEIHAGVEAP